MKKLLSFKRAIQLSLTLFGLLMLFHLAIIIGIVVFDFAPIDYLWGGKMETKEELFVFEIISLGVIMLCFFVGLIRGQFISLPKLVGLSRVILWVLFVLFAINTVGNLLAESTFEKFFAIVTAILSVLCLRLAIEKVDRTDHKT